MSGVLDELLGSHVVDVRDIAYVTGTSARTSTGGEVGGPDRGSGT